MTSRSQNYAVSVDGQERVAQVEPGADQTLLVRLEGRDEPLSVRVLSEGERSVVVVDGRVFELERAADGSWIAERERCVVRAEPAATARPARHAAKPEAGPVKLRSPMPGRVVKVLVSVGDAVTAGAAVVVIEAMKMENELAAPRAGVVTRVLVKAGDAVDRDALLVEID